MALCTRSLRIGVPPQKYCRCTNEKNIYDLVAHHHHAPELQRRLQRYSEYFREFEWPTVTQQPTHPLRAYIWNISNLR